MGPLDGVYVSNQPSGQKGNQVDLISQEKTKKKEEGETSPAEARGLHSLSLSRSLSFRRAPGFPVAAA